ncbi:MAG: BatA domain-containing protein [bacterium]
MFSFLNPLMLFGLIAGAIPLIIHFLTKRKTQRFFWGSIRFLKEMEENKRSRINIDFFLLLLLRILIILFFCAALARPLASLGFLRLGKKEAKTVIFLIDNSYSMGYREGGDTLFSKAKKKAKKIIAGISMDDEANIIFFNEKPSIRVSDFTNNKQTLNNILQNEELSFAKTKGQSALDLANELFGKSKNSRKILYILSDFQKNGFSEIHLIGEVEIVPIIFKPKEISNLMVTDIEFPDYISAKNITRINVRLKNIGKEKKTRLALYLEKNKIGEIAMALKNDSKEDAVFFYSFPEKGVYKGFVEIEGGDGLKIDNRFYFRVEVMDPLRVLLLTDNKDGDEENFYIKQAFFGAKDSPIILETASVNPGTKKNESVIPSGSEESVCEERFLPSVEMTRLVGRTDEKISYFSAVIINNVSKIDERLQDALLKFANSGGGVLISLGNNISIKDYNENSSLLPAVPKFKIGSEEEAGKYFKITYFDKSHPIFSIFTAESFASSRFYSFYMVGAIHESPLHSHVLAGFDDGVPFIVEKKIGAGKVLLFTSPLDSDWSDFPLRPNYLPLLHQAVYYLAGARSSTPTLNFSPEESDLSYISDDEINKKLVGAIHESPLHFGSKKVTNVKEEISSIFLLLVLVLLIFENIISNKKC